VQVGDTLHEVPLSDLNILFADLRIQQAVADWPAGAEQGRFKIETLY
jgi:hypothetical protein